MALSLPAFFVPDLLKFAAVISDVSASHQLHSQNEKI